MATKGTLMVDPATGAISAPVLAAGFRNNNGLQIGLNIQAWSADLDSFATLATWTGNNLSFANTDLDLGTGDFSTDGNAYANIVGADEVEVGSVLKLNNQGTGTFYGEILHSGLLTAARTLTFDFNNANRQMLLAGDLSIAGNLITSGGHSLTFTTTGATSITLPTSGTVFSTASTIGYANGGTNATTQGAAIANIGGNRHGLANGAAVLAATPDYINQDIRSNDGYWGVSDGVSAADVNPFAIVSAGQIFFLQDTQFSSSTVYIDRALQAGYAGGNYEHWMKNNGADNVTNYQNTSASYYSGAAYHTSDGYKVAALAMANASSATTLRDKFFMHGNTHGAGRFATIPPIVELGQDFDYSGGGFVGHGFIQCIGGNGGLFGTAIWGLHATNSTGTIGVWVNADAAVGIKTQTLAASAALTVNGTASVTGEIISTGGAAAVVIRSQAGGNGGQLWCPDNDRVQLNSAVNGEIWRYSNTTATTTFAYGAKVSGPFTSGSSGTAIGQIKHGVATLVGGTVTVSESTVTANSRIFLTSQSDGGTPGWVRVSARSASTNFTITSSSGTDTSVIGWVMLEP